MGGMSHGGALGSTLEAWAKGEVRDRDAFSAMQGARRDMLAAVAEGRGTGLPGLYRSIGDRALDKVISSTNILAVELQEVLKLRAAPRHLSAAVHEIRLAHDALCERLAARWSAGGFPSGHLGAEAVAAMRKLVTVGHALGHGQDREAMVTLLNAAYPPGADRQQLARVDSVMADALAADLTRREAAAPDVTITAMDTAAELEVRRPGFMDKLEAAIHLRTVRATGAHEDVPFEGAVHAERHALNRKFDTWTMPGPGGRVLGRDPFDGPASETLEMDTGVTRISFHWRGEPLGRTRASALASFAEDHPAAFAAAAARCADRLAAKRVQDPEGHAEEIQKLRADVLQISERIPPILNSELGFGHETRLNPR